MFDTETCDGASRVQSYLVRFVCRVLSSGVSPILPIRRPDPQNSDLPLAGTGHSFWHLRLLRAPSEIIQLENASGKHRE